MLTIQPWMSASTSALNLSDCVGRARAVVAADSIFAYARTILSVIFSTLFRQIPAINAGLQIARCRPRSFKNSPRSSIGQQYVEAADFFREDFVVSIERFLKQRAVDLMMDGTISCRTGTTRRAAAYLRLPCHARFPVPA